MPDDVTLTAEPRAERGSRPAGRLRRAGRVPAVVYGLGSDTQAVTVPARELTNILAKGSNTLITLRLDGDEALTLARQVQRDPTRGDLVHVDFIRVRTDVAVAAEVPLHLTGEPAGARDGGIVEQLIFNLPIEAKPQDIPTAIEHDISALEIGDQTRVAELTLPAGVTATVEEDALVAQVIAPRVVEEEVPEEVEGEEGVEGEAAEGEGAAEAEAESTPSESDEGGGE
ncbi:MAG TPA: 50S ribosomal protein L25 [Acidimicrobiia bacterium]|jgi:large subunit ribosomal protein L25